MKATEFRKYIMQVMQESHHDDYWISTNFVCTDLDEIYHIQATPQRVGTNLNILKRLGYVDRLDEMPVWKLTNKGVTVNTSTVVF